MNRQEWAGRERLAGDHGQAARKALARYAGAKEPRMASSGRKTPSSACLGSPR
jgi:hypothetical protein